MRPMTRTKQHCRHYEYLLQLNFVGNYIISSIYQNFCSNDRVIAVEFLHLGVGGKFKRIRVENCKIVFLGDTSYSLFHTLLLFSHNA